MKLGIDIGRFRLFSNATDKKNKNHAGESEFRGEEKGELLI